MLTPITVLARITAKGGLEETVFSELLTLVDKTRQEEGCINYDLYRSNNDPAVFIFHETWRSQEDLDKHVGMPHLQAFRSKVPDLLMAPAELSFWERVG